MRLHSCCGLMPFVFIHFEAVWLQCIHTLFCHCRTRRITFYLFNGCFVSFAFSFQRRCVFCVSFVIEQKEATTWNKHWNGGKTSERASERTNNKCNCYDKSVLCVKCVCKENSANKSHGSWSASSLSFAPSIIAINCNRIAFFVYFPWVISCLCFLLGFCQPWGQ